MEPHVDGCWRLSVLVQGDMSESGNSMIRLGSAGRVSCKAPDFVHSDHFGPDGTLIVSAILTDRLQTRLGFRFSEIQALGWHSTDGPSLQGLRLASALVRKDGRVAEDALRLLMRQFSLAQPPLRRFPPCVRHVVLRLMAAEAPALGALAADLDMHPVSMNRVFRRVHGCSMTSYRQRWRLTAAARVLMESDDDLTEVALAHKFSDLSHMTRLFRRELDTPPGAFRDSMRQLRAFDSSETAWNVDL